MLICPACGSRGWTPPCPCGGWRVYQDCLDDPEEYGLPPRQDDLDDPEEHGLPPRQDELAVDKLGRSYERNDN